MDLVLVMKHASPTLVLASVSWHIVLYFLRFIVSKIQLAFYLPMLYFVYCTDSTYSLPCTERTMRVYDRPLPRGCNNSETGSPVYQMPSLERIFCIRTYIMVQYCIRGMFQGELRPRQDLFLYHAMYAH
jgi:hypothetical protein